MRMQNKGLCSICCLGYNHAPFIRKCIEAIWAQDYKNIEIIALDDGSSDNSIEILEQLKKESPVPMKVIAQPNSGNVGENFNTTFLNSSGEFVLFMSLDDKLYPHAISEKMIDMNLDEHIAFIANSVITGIDDNDNISNVAIPPLKLNEIVSPDIDDLLRLEHELSGTFYIQGTVFRSSIVKAINGFDKDMVGDDIILRTRFFRYIKSNSKYTFKILKSPACYYRMHDNNIHKNSFRQVEIVALYLEKYWPNHRGPKILKNWIRHTIKNSDIKTGFKVFLINKITLRYAFYPSLWMVLVKRILKTLRSRR